MLNSSESIFKGFLKRFLGVSPCVSEGAIHRGVQVDKCEEFSEISTVDTRDRLLILGKVVVEIVEDFFLVVRLHSFHEVPPA